MVTVFPAGLAYSVPLGTRVVTAGNNIKTWHISSEFGVGVD